ncbi:MAG: hypothetical protein II480_02300 [Bacteroidales bacterium]|jgi:hypothetical protein|nr:hypothetical protein [Bacteroidales bacterium]
MRKRAFFILICAIITFVVSCGAFKQCDDVGTEFYNCLKNRDYDLALQYLDDEAVKATPREIWMDGFKEKDSKLGFLLTVQRRDFESYTVDNVTRLAIKYKNYYTNGVAYERLEFIERMGDFKITFYQYNEDSTLVIK